MQTTLVVEANKYPPFIRVYAKRHSMPPRVVQEISMLHYAAMMEFMAGTQELSITQARRKFVEKYPSANCIETSAKLCSAGGTLFNASVLSLVQPYPTAIWDVPQPKHQQVQMI